MLQYKDPSALQKRFLEIGPGKNRIPNFETLNLEKNARTEGSADHVGDARSLPFSDNTFDIVYSSHCIEHVNWYEIKDTIKEWTRVLKDNGSLEVWTVNGYAIAKAVVEYEEREHWNGPQLSEWKNKNIQKLINDDPYLWAGGRLFSYARSGEYDSNLHRALITPKFLKNCFLEAGLRNIRDMDPSEVRGYDHGWINMGVCGEK